MAPRWKRGAEHLERNAVLVEIQTVGGSNTEQGNGLATLHYTSGNNLDGQGNYTPGKAGFNLADVSSVEELNALPDGVMGLVWLDQYSGVNQSFIDAVTPFIGNPKVYGFFLVDEPDPTGQWGTQASAADLKAESDWIHSHVPGAKTFITMMNMGSTDDPSFANTYNWDNTHIDLFGLDPYPVRSNGTLDFDVIDKHVAAALDAGISLDQIVPVYQTFGGGGWATDTGGQYAMPTVAQAQEIFAHWDALVPNPAFDYAYSWGSQNGDVALESSQGLQDLFLQHNTSEDTAPVPPVDNTDTPPVVDAGGSTPPVVDEVGSTPPVVDAGGSTAPDDNAEGSAPPVDIADGSAPGTIDPVGSVDPVPVYHDVSYGRGGGFGHGLDFSQLLDTGRFSWVGQVMDRYGFSGDGSSESARFSWRGDRHESDASIEAGTDVAQSPALILDAGRFSWAGQLVDRGGFSGVESSESTRFSWRGDRHESDASIEAGMDSRSVTGAAQSPALEVFRTAGMLNTDHHSWHW
jgi:hypothetical protein